MRVTLNRAALANALAVVTPAASKPGGSLPVLTGVHIDAGDEDVALTCSDLDLTIRTSVGGVIPDQGGTVVAPAQLLRRIVAASKRDTVTLEYVADANELAVTIGRAVTNVRCLHVDDWPKVGDVHGDPVQLSADAIAMLPELVRYASGDDNRPVLTGVHFAAGHVEATDSYRLMRAPATLPDGLDILVPAAVAAHLDGDVTLVSDGHLASFTVGDTVYTTRLIGGDFPQLDRFDRQGDPHAVTVDAGELREAIAAVTPVLGESNGIRLRLDGDELVVRALDPDVGDACATIAASGSLPGEIGFNPRYLADVVATFDGDVTIGSETVLKPVLVRCDRAWRMLMPVKVK